MAECLDGPADAISPTHRDKAVESPIEALPNELLNAILSEMEGLKARNFSRPHIVDAVPIIDFKSYSLISRRWRALSLPYIFNTIKLKLPPNCPSIPKTHTSPTSLSRRFLDFLRDSPESAACIRKLEVSTARQPYGPGEEAILSLVYLRTILQYTPALRELVIEEMAISMDLDMVEATDRDFQASRTLRKLTIRCCTPASSYSQNALSWTLGLFTAIEILKLDDFEREDDDGVIIAATGRQADLSALYIDELDTWAENNINCIFSMLLTNNIARRLTSLAISFSNASSCNPMSLVGFLPEVCTTLRRLALIWLGIDCTSKCPSCMYEQT